MVPGGNKAKRLSSVNHTTRTIHHHHHHHHYPCSMLVYAHIIVYIHNVYILEDMDGTVLIRRIYISSSCTIISILQN